MNGLTSLPRLSIVAAALLISSAAQAQSPSKTQQDGVRANCRSDFMANCASVTPGGREAFMCLEQNKAKLSAGCRSAVDAIAASAAPKPAAAPAETKPAATAPAETPAPTATAPTAPTSQKPATKPVPAPKAAAAPARPAAPPPPAAPVATPAAVTTPSAAPTAPKRTTLTEAVIIRRFCFTDFRVLCKGTQLGGGRAIQCLAANRDALSPGCKTAMADTGN